MANLLLSKFETYLLDEEVQLEYIKELQDIHVTEMVQHEEYPEGFFTSL